MVKQVQAQSRHQVWRNGFLGNNENTGNKIYTIQPHTQIFIGFFDMFYTSLLPLLSILSYLFLLPFFLLCSNNKSFTFHYQSMKPANQLLSQCVFLTKRILFKRILVPTCNILFLHSMIQQAMSYFYHYTINFL